jgi:hypothetical protein
MKPIKPKIFLEEFDRRDDENPCFEIYVEFDFQPMRVSYRSPTERKKKLALIRQKAKELADRLGVKVTEVLNPYYETT